MFGVKEPALRKKLLQERHLTQEKAIKICKSGETTAQHLKDLATATDRNEIQAMKHRKETPKSFKGCQKMQILWRKSRSKDKKNFRRIKRLAGKCEGVIPLRKSVYKGWTKEKNRSTQSQLFQRLK